MKVNFKKSKIMKSMGAIVAAATIIVMMPISASAHCDTMDGPTVADGFKAMENNNVNYVLKWIQPEYEDEITDKFNLSMKVKDLSPEAKEIAEQYFFGELVRIHRAGEDAPFDGLKPYGTPADEKVLAADESLVVGDLSPLEGLIEEEKMPELEERFEKVMSLKDYDVNNVKSGRKYIEAYVKFFKFAEGEEDHDAHGAVEDHDKEVANSIVSYTVVSGDTLSEIASKFSTTYPEIQKANNIINPHLIYPGQALVIPAK